MRFSDRVEYLRMGHYFRDMDTIGECQSICRLDPQCMGYSYAFPVCRLFGDVRQGAPLTFAFRQPDHSAARIGFRLTKIDATIAPKPGQPEDLCFIRVLVAVEVESDSSFTDFLVSPIGVTVTLCTLVFVYFALSYLIRNFGLIKVEEKNSKEFF